MRVAREVYVRRSGAWVGAATVMLLVGCTADGSAGPASSAPPPTGDLELEVTSADWVPDHPIEHTTYTEEERLAWRDEWMASQARQWEIADPPEVELVRWMSVRDEYERVYSDCLTAAGFPSKVNWEGYSVFDPGVPESHTEALNLAIYICQSQYPLVPQLSSELTDEQLGMWWDYWTEAYLPCLEAHGVGVQAEYPTRETFVAEFYSENRWWAPDNLPVLTWSEAKLAELTKLCPVYPPAEYFFGI